jgi:hypothetical protein
MLGRFFCVQEVDWVKLIHVINRSSCLSIGAGPLTLSLTPTPTKVEIESESMAFDCFYNTALPNITCSI